MHRLSDSSHESLSDSFDDIAPDSSNEAENDDDEDTIDKQADQLVPDSKNFAINALTCSDQDILWRIRIPQQDADQLDRISYAIIDQSGFFMIKDTTIQVKSEKLNELK